MSDVDTAIRELRENRPIIIFDRENENEGDLVFPAERISIDVLNFMLNNCKGVICQTLLKEVIGKLEIPILQKFGNNKTGQTNFIYPTDHVNSETGISSKDRELIIKELVSDDADKNNLVLPGHQNLLKISEGGLASRQGHTESSSYLVREAGFKESAVICEIIDENGVPMRHDGVLEFSKKHNVKVILLNDIYCHFLKKTRIDPPLRTFKNPYDLLGSKNVVITGSSSGIGMAVKDKLSSLGCNVTELNRTNGRDVTDFGNINSYIRDNVDNVDVLINCAGYIEPSSIESMTLDIWNSHVNTNLTSIFNLTNQLLPKFNPDKGAILNVSSPSARKIRAGWSAYCCSKAAVNSLTLNCAEELKSRNICVNGISPTKTNTPMIHRLFPEIEEENLINPDVIANYIISIVCDSFANGGTGVIYEVTNG